MKCVAAVPLSIAVVFMASCATLRNALNFQEPQIQLQEINITGMGLTGGTLDLAFDVYNPNDYRLRSTRLEVALDGLDLRLSEQSKPPVEL